MAEDEQTTEPVRDAAKPGAVRSDGGAERSPLWLGLLASTAAFSAYLALLGGGLLAVRFWHAGLPVTQAVGEVPLSTLVTTALVELFIPVSLLALVGGISLLVVLANRRRQAGTPAQRRTGLTSGSKTGIFLCILLAVPPNPLGLALLCGTLAILFAERWIPILTSIPCFTERHVIGASVAVLLLVCSLPLLARQLIEPLYMERVRIERVGQPAIIADLVAVRDTSIVIARCHHLFVLPMPASLRIESLPSELGTGASIFEKLGISLKRPDDKPQPMPC